MIRKLIELGTAGRSVRAARVIRVHNMEAVLVMGAITVVAPILASLGLVASALSMAFGFVGYGLALVITHRGHTSLARHLTALTSCLWLFGADVFAHVDTLGYLFFILLAFGTWTVFPAEERRAAWIWTAVELAIGLVVTVIATGYRNTGDDVVFIRWLNLAAMAGIIVAVAYYNHRATAAAELALEDLLHNVLPPTIADRLQRGEPVADRFDTVTVLFADLVGFTPKAEGLPPDRVVAMLDDMFRRFDAHCDRLGLEKIKTIGDAYMAASGIPIARDDHARAAVELAMAMQQEVSDGLQLRIGIHTGPVVAGVIGARKFAYDLWGDTVNTASRMESHGVAGRIQVTEAVRDALGDRYDFEARGPIAIKGKGEMPVYLLVGPAR